MYILGEQPMAKKNNVITTCPVCSHDLHITHLSCDHCHTEIKGEFSFSKFNYLNVETLYFIEVFVKNRGNIKAVEKEMNISYPTVKKYLDEAITALGYNADESVDKEEGQSQGVDMNYIRTKQQEVLNKIKEGEIKVEEALKMIKKIKGETK